MTRPPKPTEPPPTTEPVVDSAVDSALDPAELAKTLAPNDLAASVTKVDAEAEPDPVQPVSSGSRIGRFLLLDKLGEGGMGVVFAARDEQLDRKIAIKLLLPGMQQGRERLLREARALARLTHPNVVTVHDVGTLGERVYVAMEFVEGVTLTSWLTESRPWQDILQVFLQAADGLAAAHDAGIVHRDFKPDNVLVGRDGRVRVLDFGLAKGGGLARESAGDHRVADPSEPLDDQNLTRTGAMMGTPAYMAPEQFLGGEIDARTDQFSFCIALYEGLMGVRPFAGTTLADLARAVTQGLMIPTPRDRPIPSAIHRVLERGLSPRQEGRFPSMHDLRRALARAGSPKPAARRTRWPALLGLLAVVAIGGAGLWLEAASTTDELRQTSRFATLRKALLPAVDRPAEGNGSGSIDNEEDEPRSAAPRHGRSRPVLPAAGVSDDPPPGAAPLPSVTDCPPYHPPARAPVSAERQLNLLTATMASQPLQGEKLLETLASLAEHHQRNDDEASACAVAQRFLSLTPSEHPGRWDMMCLERQLECRTRLDRAKVQGSTSWSRAEEARAPDSTLDGPARDRYMRSAVDGLEQACRAGHAVSCMRAAEILEDPEETVRDPSRARSQYQRACRMGELDGCPPLRTP